MGGGRVGTTRTRSAACTWPCPKRCRRGREARAPVGQYSCSNAACSAPFPGLSFHSPSPPALPAVMTRSGPMMYVYDHAEQMQGHPHEHADPEILDFVGHEFDRPGRNYPLRGSAPSPPPPYEPISYPLPSPLPTPTFPAPQHTTATIADTQHLRPAPHHLLNDRAFSPDPRDNPHFIMTSDERFLSASPPPRESHLSTL